jgi:hypothetical protein
MAQFTFETVDGSGTVLGKGQSCLAVDKNGNPRIAYAGPNGNVMLASRDAGAWTLEKLPFGTNVESSDFSRVCLEIDSESNPQIAYTDRSSGHLIYGVKRNNNWTFTPVPTSIDFLTPRGVSGFSFRLHNGQGTPELRDTPHFVFLDSVSQQLGYTRKVAGQFKLVHATPGDDPNNVPASGLGPSMAFEDISGDFVIAYITAISNFNHVRFKRIRDPFEGTLDAMIPVDSGQFEVFTTCISTSGASDAVAYLDITNQKLKAAVLDFDFNPPNLSIKIVATTSEHVVPSLARLRRSGDFRIAYGEANQLKFASRNQFGEWSVAVVDPDGGGMPSLAYGDLVAHIAYADTVRGTLKYAKGTE